MTYDIDTCRDAQKALSDHQAIRSKLVGYEDLKANDTDAARLREAREYTHQVVAHIRTIAEAPDEVREYLEIDDHYLGTLRVLATDVTHIAGEVTGKLETLEQRGSKGWGAPRSRAQADSNFTVKEKKRRFFGWGKK